MTLQHDRGLRVDGPRDREPGHDGSAAQDANEDKASRLDRELAELLQELRVILPGAQVLFAFLLAVPFSSRIDITTSQRALLLVALFATGLSTVLLVAPGVQHRLRWREQDKERLLQSANRFTIVATGSLAVAMLSALFVVTDALFDAAIAAGVVGVLFIVLMSCWYVSPLAREVRDKRTHGPSA